MQLSRSRVVTGAGVLAAVVAIAAPIAVAANRTATGQASASTSLTTPKMLFMANCGACHAFAPAHTTAKKGPNFNRERPDFYELVDKMNSGGGGMPSFKKLLSPAKIKAIANFVSHA